MNIGKKVKNYITAFCLVLYAIVLVNNYILLPYLKMFYPNAPMLTIPPAIERIIEYITTAYLGLLGAKKVIDLMVKNNS